MYRRIAVASSDGKVVNRHFGSTPYFAVFDQEPSGTYRFVELRENRRPACRYGIQASLELLADCQAVLASRIGPEGLRALASRGIKAIEVRNFIAEALTAIDSQWEEGG